MPLNETHRHRNPRSHQAHRIRQTPARQVPLSLFDDKREVELVWNGKTGEITNIVLPFQVIEQVDEPRVQTPGDTGTQFDLFDTRGKGADSFIAMIYERLVLMRDLLAEDGRIYVHCDYRVNSYIKLVLDEIFSNSHYKSEIIWKRTFNAGSSKAISNKFPNNTDSILWFSKSGESIFNKQIRPLNEGALKRYDKVDETGRRFKWNPMKTYSEERLRTLMAAGEAKVIPTSKYPIYNSGTTLAVTEKLGRKWIDSDLGKFAIHTSRKRLIGVQRQLKAGKDFRAFEFEMGFFPNIQEEAKTKGIDPALKYIPREVFDKGAIEKNQIVFHDVSYIEVKPLVKKNTIAVELTDFSVFYSQDTVENAAAYLKDGANKIVVENGIVTREMLTKAWTDWIDYWSVDFDFESKKEIIREPDPITGETEEHYTGDFIFENEWQSFRTKKDRSLELTTPYHEVTPGRWYKIAVKVINIVGNDTMKIVEVGV